MLQAALMVPPQLELPAQWPKAALDSGHDLAIPKRAPISAHSRARSMLVEVAHAFMGWGSYFGRRRAMLHQARGERLATESGPSFAVTPPGYQQDWCVPGALCITNS